MSYSELKVVESNGDVVEVCEQRNASATRVIWDALVERYSQEHDPLKRALEGPMWLFDKWETLSMKPWEVNVYLFTCDHILIGWSDAELLVRSMRMFSEAHAKPHHVNHLPEWSMMIEKLITSEKIRGCEGLEPLGYRGIGLYANSVSDDLWMVSEEDDYRPYNVDKDTGHRFLKLRPMEEY